MFRKTVSSVMLVLLVTSLLVLAVKIQPVGAIGTITINADGSITPSKAPIQRNGDTYTLTDNIAVGGDGIQILRDNIVLSGAGCTITKSAGGYGRGITLTNRSNVTVGSMTIKSFDEGIYLSSSSGNTLSGNTLANNYGHGILLDSSSDHNILSGNNLADDQGISLWSSSGNTLSGNTIVCSWTTGGGIALSYSSYNVLSGNTVANHGDGVFLGLSSGNTLVGNTVTANKVNGIGLADSSYNLLSSNTLANNGYGIGLYTSSSNSIFHNSFVDNTKQTNSHGSFNVWDDGYPSGGNYWSDYATRYPDAAEIDHSGLWNTPYVIDADNQDNYPLMPRYDVTINAHCDTEGESVSVPITEDGSATGYTAPHTFNGISGSHTFTVPSTDGGGHPFQQWSTGETSTTITVSSAETYTAYYQATPPPTYAATIGAHCNTEGADVSVGIGMDGSSTGYATPHTFTGLTGSHTFTVPNTDGNGHHFKQWNTGQTTTTITVTLGGIYTANYEATPPANYDVTVKAHCNTEGADVSGAIAKDGSSTGFNTPHTFFTLTGTHTFMVPSTDNAGHAFSQWNTGQTSTTISVTSGGTYTAYYQAFSPQVHDIALSNLTSSKTIVGQGYLLPVNLTVTNLSNFLETCNVTCYGNQTIFAELLNINLSSESSATITSLWNITGLGYGNYMLSAYAWPVLGETNMANNNFTGGGISVTILGDVNGDFGVDILDAITLASSTNIQPGIPRWNPNADLNGDDIIDIYDAIILAGNYGKTA